MPRSCFPTHRPCHRGVTRPLAAASTEMEETEQYLKYHLKCLVRGRMTCDLHFFPPIWGDECGSERSIWNVCDIARQISSFRIRAMGLVTGMKYLTWKPLRRYFTENVHYEPIAFRVTFMVLWCAIPWLSGRALPETALGKCHCIGREMWWKTLPGASCGGPYTE